MVLRLEWQNQDWLPDRKDREEYEKVILPSANKLDMGILVKERGILEEV